MAKLDKAVGTDTTEAIKTRCVICGKLLPPNLYNIINPNKEKKYCICEASPPASELID
jgi:hypothetical protein